MGYCQRLSSYFVFGFFVIALQNPLSAQELTPPSNIFQAIDHIVYVVPNLEEAIVQIKNSFGITPTLGGSHPGRGTRNALISLSDTMYLEIIAPDPQQPQPPNPRAFDMDANPGPRLATWLARTDDIEDFHKSATSSGLILNPIMSMSRILPTDATGVKRELHWRLTFPPKPLGDGIFPAAFIQWDLPTGQEHLHPAKTSEKGVRLIRLIAIHPHPALIAADFLKIGLKLPVEQGSRTSLIAVFDTPQGIKVLQ